MPAMRRIALLLMTLAALPVAPLFAETSQPTEADFRKSLGIGSAVRLDYRDTRCRLVDFAGFVAAMKEPGARASVDRAVDGTSVTMSAKLRGMADCPSPYPPVTVMPPFDLKDLSGKRVTSGSLRGKPTLISFFFATCVPCILEVEPLNRYAAARPHMNFLAVTFDDPAEARAFVKRFGVRWRVVPDAQDLVERMRVKQFPLMALFDANGRLLGTRKGGARDELEAANVEPQLSRWVDGLLEK
jgi:cytochrome oxidase Cu insertion factor (SCO1/SenC/PrrC family)